MSEQDLIELGFERVDVSAEESGDVPFHYYEWEPPFNTCFCLITADDNDNDNDEWAVMIFDYTDYEFKTKEEVKTLQNLFINAYKPKTNE